MFFSFIDFFMREKSIPDQFLPSGAGKFVCALRLFSISYLIYHLTIEMGCSVMDYYEIVSSDVLTEKEKKAHIVAYHKKFDMRQDGLGSFVDVVESIGFPIVDENRALKMVSFLDKNPDTQEGILFNRMREARLSARFPADKVAMHKVIVKLIEHGLLEKITHSKRDRSGRTIVFHSYNLKRK